MPAKRRNGEAGYSLVEVMVSIMLLTIAIIPMVGMFDAALNSATKGSSYDKARTLANLKLEQAKSLPFDSGDEAIQDVEHNFPEPAGPPTAYDDGPGKYQSGPMTESGAAAADFAGFTYDIEKQYMDQPPTYLPDDELACPLEPEDWCPSSTPTDLIRVTVTVEWGDGNTYTTFGLVAR